MGRMHTHTHMDAQTTIHISYQKFPFLIQENSKHVRSKSRVKQIGSQNNAFSTIHGEMKEKKKEKKRKKAMW